jgi:type IV secretory pathway VirB2 component (pilin)
VTTTTQPQVASPIHAALQRLLTQIEGDQPTMANALKSTCQQMGGDQVWFGSTASSWESDLNGCSGKLSGSIAAAVAVVAQALASTPATCTPSEAKMENLFLEGY